MLHAEQFARVFDVLRYLGFQRVDSGESALFAQAMHELHAQPSPIDVLREVEQVDLEREQWVPGRAGLGDLRTKGGIEPEVGRARDGWSARQEARAHRVHAHRRQQLVAGADVRGWPAQLPAAAGAL